MKISTDKDVEVFLVNPPRSDYFSSAAGDGMNLIKTAGVSAPTYTPSTPSSTVSSTMASAQSGGGNLMNKIQSGVQTGQQAVGLLGQVKQMFGGLFGKSSGQSNAGFNAPISTSPAPSMPTKSKGMSTTTKVLIGVGVVGVIALIAYAAKGSSKK